MCAQNRSIASLIYAHKYQWKETYWKKTKTKKSVLSLLHRLSTWRYPHLLLRTGAPAARRPQRTYSFDRHLLPAWRSTQRANPPAAVAGIDRSDTLWRSTLNALNKRSVYLSISAFTRKLHCIWLRCTSLSSSAATWFTVSSRRRFEVPRCNLARYGQRSFNVSGPSLWNSLPLTVRDLSRTLTKFCTRLKTFLFTRAYGTSS